MTSSPGEDPTIGVLEPTSRATTAGEVVSGLSRGAAVGRYVIIRTLGSGGMGTVYAAHDPQLDRQVALKLVHPTLGADPEALIHEAKALARLDDPHVVQVFDAGEHEGEVFIAMQLVAGEDLMHALAKRKPRTAQIISWFADAGRGLAAAHAAGLVHRDFKPSNVLIDHRGRIAVTDFGLARNTHAADETAPKGLLGTPSYMAPEQHGMEPATEASDQFAFCVALWEALFGQHPFVVGDRRSMSPFAIGHAIFDGPLIPPPRGTRVPRKVTEILTRGLARKPAERWPSMTELVAQLAPIERRRIWPVIAIATVAAIASGAAVWLHAVRANREPSCELAAAHRVGSVWTPGSAASIKAKFAETGLSYAAATADVVNGSLDRYANRWQQLATDVCTAERGASGATSDLLVRRRACLDTSLDGLGGLVEVLGREVHVEFLDHATAMTETLPALADCIDGKALLAGPGVPPLPLATQTTQVETELDRAMARFAGGRVVEAVAEIRALTKRAEALGWGPTIAIAHEALGHALEMSQETAAMELVHAANVAIANRLDRLAVRALSGAIHAAGFERKPELATGLVELARGVATRTADRGLSLRVEIAYGRALVYLERWTEALPICRPAIAAAQALDEPSLVELANDCVFEALAPAGEDAELRRIASERIAAKTKLFGPDYAPLADLLVVRAESDAGAGELVAARSELERAFAILAKAYPDHHSFTDAQAVRIRGVIELLEGKADQGIASLRAALEMAKVITPTPNVVIASIDTSLAFALERLGDHAAAMRAFEDGIKVTRIQAGNDSVELAILLLDYGQLEATDNLEAGLGVLGEAREILERKHDNRASFVASALAVVEASAKRWPAARAHAEEGYASLQHDSNADPGNLAGIEFVLAQSIVETHGDRKRARALAIDARARLAKLGPGLAPVVKNIEQWLAHHR